MTRLFLLLSMTMVLGAAAPKDEFIDIEPVQKQLCVPTLYQGFGYHDCLNGLWLTTSVWPGACDVGCPYIFSVTMEVDEECSDDKWQSVQSVGVMECGGFVNTRFTFDGDQVAWASANCSTCDLE